MSLSMSQSTPLDKDADARTRQEDETAGEMDVTIESSPSGCVIGTMKHRNSGSKPPYQAFLGQLYALIEGAIDGNRYEDSCRQLLGNQSYTLFGLDKVIQQTLKCLQAMTNDESVNKLIGLFVYHKSKGRVSIPYALSSNGTANAPSSSFSTSKPITVENVAMDVDTNTEVQKEVVKEKDESSAMKVTETNEKDQDNSNNNFKNEINDNNNNSNVGNSVDVSGYQAHVSRVLLSFTEDIYRIQLLSLGNFESDSEYQHVACQCLGVLGLGGVPVYSPPAIASLALSTAAAAAASAVQGNVSSSLSLSLPSSSTTFASISNVIATVYDVAGLVTADDLSTSALEDALLPPQPPSAAFPSSLPLSHSGSQIALNNENNMIVRKERERDEKDSDGPYGRGNAETYWNTSHDEENQHYDTIKNKNGNETSISQKQENNEMNFKEENSVGDSVNIKSEMTDSNKSDFGTERIAKNDFERETDLNMNGEAINVAEMDCEIRDIEESKGSLDLKVESL